jgi:hypothetical protein
VAPIDITALRHERDSRQGHHMLSQLRTEAYPVYADRRYPASTGGPLTYEENIERIETAKRESRAATRPAAEDRHRRAAPRR